MEGPTAANQEPSIFLISLHIVMWTVLVGGFVMVLVVFMLN
jgi:hypothetical protein